MANLETTYMGLKLKNPIVVSSSGLTDSIDKLVKLEKAGAGAVVLKSIFEEQINSQADALLSVDSQANVYAEAQDYINNYIKANDLDIYLSLIKEAKEKLSIPVIASINCVNASEWVDFAQKIESAGADAIEVNVFVVPIDKYKDANEYEEIYYKIVDDIKSKIKIPISIKLGSYFTNLLRVANKLHGIGADALVLFNRFYEPDIDIDTLKITSADLYSYPSEIRKTLRWVGMLSPQISNVEISASTGVHDSEAVIKLLLAGAQTVQVCSLLYQEGFETIGEIIEEISKWMNEKEFKYIKDFRGMLSYKRAENPAMYERSQFMKYFSNAD